MTARTALLTVTLTAAAALPAPALAATRPIDGGRTTLRPARALKLALARSGTRQAALAPARHPGRAYTLPVAGGTFSFARCNGTIRDKGALRLRRGRRTVRIGRLSFVLGRRSAVRGTINSHRMTIFKIDRHHARTSGSHGRCVISGLRLAFTPAAAARIDALLGRRLLSGRAEAAAATLAVTAGHQPAASTPSPSSAPAPSPSAPGPQSPPTSGGLLGLPGLPGFPGLPGLPEIPGLPAISGLTVSRLAAFSSAPAS